MIILKIILTLFASVASGILGRMGGAQGYHTLYRDVGCSFLSVLIFVLWFGFKLNYWYLYLISFGLHWGAFSTYWDALFGYDNYWFAGFVTGLTLLPLMFIYKTYLPYFIVRMLILAIIWGTLKYLPGYVWKFRHDVMEEFLRYFSIIITYYLLLIR